MNKFNPLSILWVALGFLIGAVAGNAVVGGLVAVGSLFVFTAVIQVLVINAVRKQQAQQAEAQAELAKLFGGAGGPGRDPLAGPVANPDDPA